MNTGNLTTSTARQNLPSSGHSCPSEEYPDRTESDQHASSSAPSPSPRRGSAWPHGERPHVPRGAMTARDGLLLIDKPQGMTSHDVVALTRRMAATRKVGHAGTLDPMATGLLVVGVGKATRLLTYLVGADKTYRATIRLGVATTTDDAEGQVLRAHGAQMDTILPTLDAAMARLRGDIMQVPCSVSAIKVDGVRSYTRARDGEQVDLDARPVRIDSFHLEAPPRAVTADGTSVVDCDVSVTCSSGTYVRALARDLGEDLGCGAHLTRLRRHVVGPFSVDQAYTLDSLAADIEADALTPEPRGASTMSLAEVARRCFPTIALTEAEVRAVSYGQMLAADVFNRAVEPAGAVTARAAQGHDLAAGFAPNGEVVALLLRARGRTRPALVLTPAGH